MTALPPPAAPARLYELARTMSACVHHLQLAVHVGRLDRANGRVAELGELIDAWGEAVKG